MSHEASARGSRPQLLTRRAALQSIAGTAAAGLLAPRLASQSDPIPHHRPRARRVIFFFLPGGLSHVDSFDYKPRLVQGPVSIDANRQVQRPLWTFRPRGQSGTWISDLFPALAEQADRLCIVRSLHTDHGNHFEATLAMHTGSTTFARPSIGSWVCHGLGSDNPNLPPFVVLAPRLPYAGAQVFDANFLPARYQGVRIQPGATPIENVSPRQPAALQRRELLLLHSLNAQHRLRHPDLSELAARDHSFTTAAAMQTAAPEVFDLRGESDATHGLYGLARGDAKSFAWQCLIARRLAERGVRFIEVIDVGASNNWDQHGDMRQHEGLARNVDRPIAGLLQDLGQRGLLEETLVVFTTEFGRTPWTDTPDSRGRGHHPSAFTVWLAGAGVRPGMTYGATDELGHQVVEGPVHVHDLHATILYLLGLDHERLTYHHAGRDYRLTDVHGNVVHALLA